MFLNVEIRKDIEVYWNNMFQYYLDDILSIQSKLNTQEDIYGRSCKQYIIARYYYAFIYVLLLYVIYKRGYYTWKEMIEQYNVTEMDKKFGCNNINLDKLLKISGLPIYTSVEQISEGRTLNNTYSVGSGITTSQSNETYSRDEILNIVNNLELCNSIF